MFTNQYRARRGIQVSAGFPLFRSFVCLFVRLSGSSPSQFLSKRPVRLIYIPPCADINSLLQFSKSMGSRRSVFLYFFNFHTLCFETSGKSSSQISLGQLYVIMKVKYVEFSRYTLFEVLRVKNHNRSLSLSRGRFILTPLFHLQGNKFHHSSFINNNNVMENNHNINPLGVFISHYDS